MTIKLFGYEKKNLLLLIALMCTMAGFVSCSDDDNAKEFILTVASEQPMFTGNEIYAPYYAKYQGSDEWTSFDYIVGLSYEEGYEYVIRVRRDKWNNGDIQDAGMYRYTLLDLISKTKKVSENIPAQRLFITIASKKVTDNVALPSNMYYAKVTGADKWTVFPEIEGFNFEEGYEYILLIDRKFNGSNSQPKFTYVYVETNNKIQKDSEGLPN